MVESQRLVMQSVVAILAFFLGRWIYRHPSKLLSLYGERANQLQHQKLARSFGVLLMFGSTYAAVVFSAGRFLPDGIAVVLSITAAIVVTGVVLRAN